MNIFDFFLSSGINVSSFFLNRSLLLTGLNKKVEESLAPSEREKLKEKIKQLAKRIGLKKELTIIEYKGCEVPYSARGNSFLPGKAGIIVNADCVRKGCKEHEFLLARSILWIKNNSYLIAPALSGIIGITTMVVLSILFPSLAITSVTAPRGIIGIIVVVALTRLSLPYSFSLPLPFPFHNAGTFIIHGLACGLASPAAILGYITSYISFCKLVQSSVERIDKKAFSICSEEGKIATFQIFKAKQKAYKDFKKSQDASFILKLRKRAIKENGDDRLNFFEPYIQTRIHYLQELQKENRSLQNQEVALR